MTAIIPFLDPYPAWVKLLISVWLLLTAAVVIALIFSGRQPEAAAPRAAAQTAQPSTAASPSHADSPVLSADTVEQLRQRNGVRGLTPFQNDLGIGQLPPGVFGFTVPWILNTEHAGVVGGTGVDQITLQKSRGGTSTMEIHKAQSGTIYVVGYASAADLSRLQDPSRRADATVALFFEHFSEFKYPVAIPADRIVRSKNRTVEGKYVNDLSVR